MGNRVTLSDLLLLCLLLHKNNSGDGDNNVDYGQPNSLNVAEVRFLLNDFIDWVAIVTLALKMALSANSMSVEEL